MISIFMKCPILEIMNIVIVSINVDIAGLFGIDFI